MNKRVVIVDDSATMRKLIRIKLETHPGLEVVGEANDPYEAREVIKAKSPDVITLDIEMPRMDGLDFLEKLMRLRPMPVVMVSSHTEKSASATIRALQLGAVDCVAKPAMPYGEDAFSSLPETVYSAARARVSMTTAQPARPQSTTEEENYDPGRKILLIGSSTGGVEALFTVLRRFPANCPPTFITQHIPANFSASFASRLNAHCAPTVCEAKDGLQLKPGMVVIAPGGDTHLEVGPGLSCNLTMGDRVSGHRPSVDQLFSSALPYAKRIAAALLTGMGRDGAEGLKKLHDAGARTFAQDEETCVVFGMPKAAIELGAADRVCALPMIAPSLLRAEVSRRARAGAGD